MDMTAEKTDPEKHPRRPIIWRSPDRYIVGVDLGQASDPTAVCVLHCRQPGKNSVLPALT